MGLTVGESCSDGQAITASGVMVMVTSFKRTYASTSVVSAPNPAAGHCEPMPPPEAPRHSQVSLAHSLLGSLFLFPGSWCTQGFVVPQSYEVV